MRKNRTLRRPEQKKFITEKLSIVEGKNKELKAKQAKKSKKTKNKENVDDKKAAGEEKLQKQVEATIKSMQKAAQGMTLRSHKQTILTSVAGSRLMNYANVYDQHKKDLAEKKKQEEEQKTIVKPFKARPVPKFVHAKTTTAPKKEETAKNVVKVAPKPKPPVAHVAPTRRTAPAVEKEKKPEPKKRTFVPTFTRKSVAEVVKKPQAPQPKPEVKKFVATVPKYLRKEPFKVNLPEKKRTTEVKPFKLSIATRIDDRHKSDAERRKIVEERNRKLMEEKKKKEEEEIKTLRKLREFRASVNPFNKAKNAKKTAPTQPVNELPAAEKA
ncbi:translation initiation factor IF-2 [Culicoides brevitarsis]|uniref:translation initiation factor IF-2 n=1 Tax=Culicoides brevitarsis TaxID=469753 RepID=UPI00307C80C0